LVGDLVRAAGKKGGLEAGADGVKLRSEGAFAQLGDKLHLQTAGTSLTLGKTELKADATKILFNSPERATEEPAPRPPEMTVIELSDKQGNPLPGQRFAIVLEDGTERVGVTDKDGSCKLELPDSGTIAFPGITLAGQPPPQPRSEADYAPYVVCQGDHLRKVAFAFGLAPDTLWDDPKNASLRELRGSGDTLAPGDILFVPRQPPPGPAVRPRTANRYRADVPTIPVNITLTDENGPIANQPYEVRGLRLHDGEPAPRGTTDETGRAELQLPANLRVVELYLPKRHALLRLGVGDMDPVEHDSGIVKRLCNAGILPENIDPGRADIAAGLLELQQQLRLPLTGRLDAATKAALKKA
ncbi:MAG: hypothetical protein IT373_36690, partial [Polyangiaceae bacterium]|nr:hypothetical protein [Polyangiaceae bacterium]